MEMNSFRLFSELQPHQRAGVQSLADMLSQAGVDRISSKILDLDNGQREYRALSPDCTEYEFFHLYSEKGVEMLKAVIDETCVLLYTHVQDGMKREVTTTELLKFLPDEDSLVHGDNGHPVVSKNALVAENGGRNHIRVPNAIRINAERQGLVDQLNEALSAKKIEDLIPSEVSLTKQVIAVAVVDHVIEAAKSQRIPLMRYQESLYWFNGQYYVRVPEDEIKALLVGATLRLGISYYDASYYAFKDLLLKQFESHSYFPAPVPNPGEVVINLQNGVLVITPNSISLEPHNSDRLLFYGLKHPYDPLAKAPKFQQFLDEVLPDKQLQNVLAEFFGSCFLPPGELKLEKALILYGSGANGKSVAFDILIEVMGRANVRHYSLSSLCDGTGYYRAELEGALLNWASEISTKMNPAVFKALVSREPVEARRPYGNAFIQHHVPPLAFNTNTLPKDTESNHGFYRRFLIVPFNQTIPKEKRNPTLAKEIIESELPGVFNWVLDGLKRILEQRGFSKSDAAEQALEAFRKNSCSVALFIDDGGFEPSPKVHLPLKELYRMYRDFCRDSGMMPLAVRFFSERLNHYGFEIIRKNQGRVVWASKKS